MNLEPTVVGLIGQHGIKILQEAAQMSPLFEDSITQKEWALRAAEHDCIGKGAIDAYTEQGLVPKIVAPLVRMGLWDKISIREAGLGILKSAGLGGGFGTVDSFIVRQEAERRFEEHVKNCYSIHLFKGTCVVRWPKRWGDAVFVPIKSNWTSRGVVKLPEVKREFFVLGHEGCYYTCKEQDFRPNNGDLLTQDPMVRIFGGSDGPAIDFSCEQTWKPNGLTWVGAELKKMRTGGELEALLK